MVLTLCLAACERSGSPAPAGQPAAAAQPMDEIGALTVEIRKSPDDAERYIVRGRAYFRRALQREGLERLTEAAMGLADFRRANELSGGGWPSEFRLSSSSTTGEANVATRPASPAAAPGRGSAVTLLEAARLARIFCRPEYASELLDAAAALNDGALGPEIREEKLLARAMQTGEWKDALAELSKLTEDSATRDSASCWFALGLARQADGDNAGAKAAYEHGLTLDPNQAECRAALAPPPKRLVVSKGASRDESSRLVREASNVFAADSYAVQLREGGRADEALTISLSLMQRHPEFPLGWLNLGRAFRAVGRTDDAIQAFETFSKIAPGAPDGQREIGETWFDLGQFDRAATSYQAALLLQPESPFILRDYGDAKRRGGQAREAELAYRRAIRSMAEYAPAWDGLAMALLEEHKPAEAREALRHALLRATTYPDIYWKLNEKTPGGRREPLSDEYRKLVDDIMQNDAEVSSQILGSLSAANRPEEIAALAEHALTLDPNDRGASIWRAVSLVQRGRPAEALADCERAVALEADAAGLEYRGYIRLLADGDQAASLADFRAALAQGATDPVAVLLTWMLECDSKQPAAAAEVLRKALAEEPKDAHYADLYRYCLGELTEDQLLERGRAPAQRCESFYYIAEKTRLEKGFAAARPYFKHCVAQDVRTYMEHQLAEWRLRRGK